MVLMVLLLMTLLLLAVRLLACTVMMMMMMVLQRSTGFFCIAIDRGPICVVFDNHWAVVFRVSLVVTTLLLPVMPMMMRFARITIFLDVTRCGGGRHNHIDGITEEALIGGGLAQLKRQAGHAVDTQTGVDRISLVTTTVQLILVERMERHRHQGTLQASMATMMMVMMVMAMRCGTVVGQTHLRKVALHVSRWLNAVQRQRLLVVLVMLLVQWVYVRFTAPTHQRLRHLTLARSA